MAFQKGHKRIGGMREGQKTKKTLEKELILKYLMEKMIEGKKPIVNALIREMKKGNIAAIKEGFDRVLGRVKEVLDINADIEYTESKLADLLKNATPEKRANFIKNFNELQDEQKDKQKTNSLE